MSNRHESILIHCVFSTKDRAPMIPEPMKPKLWAYSGGITRANEFNHHAKFSFDEEFQRFLDRHGLPVFKG
jgi:hypothetical protein